MGFYVPILTDDDLAHVFGLLHVAEGGDRLLT